jgi:hypothetical protein
MLVIDDGWHILREYMNEPNITPWLGLLTNSPFTPFDKLRTGFDTLRANGLGIEIVTDFPFVLSLSKHEHPFLSTPLLGRVYPHEKEIHHES